MTHATKNNLRWGKRQDVRCDLPEGFVEGKMAGIDDMHFGVGHVPTVGLGFCYLDIALARPGEEGELIGPPASRRDRPRGRTRSGRRSGRTGSGSDSGQLKLAHATVPNL